MRSGLRRRFFAKRKTDPAGTVPYAEKLKTSENTPTVVLSTASPYKFTRHVLTALGERATEDEFADVKRLEALSGVPIPLSLSALEKATVRHKDVVAIDEMADYVMQKTQEEI